MTEEYMLRVLATNAYLIYDLCLTGNPSPKVVERFEKITNPRWGDLVMEVSKFDPNGCSIDGSIGYLMQTKYEPVFDWDGLSDEDRRLNGYDTPDDVPKEKYYYSLILSGFFILHLRTNVLNIIINLWQNKIKVIFVIDYVLKSSLETGSIVTIIYTKDKVITKRNIKVSEIEDGSNRAYCYLRHQNRTFRRDNILAACFCKSRLYT